jgi:hypothetical protein
MNEWKCTIKTPSNWLQTVRVEAYTHSDAVAFAESQTGGKCIMAVIDNSYSSDDNESISGSSSEIDGGFVLLALAAFILIAAWKYVLVFAIIGLGIWFLLNTLKE